MKLNKAEQNKLGLKYQGLYLGKQGIKSVNKNLNTLNTSNREEIEANPSQSNVNKVLTSAEQKTWKKLSIRQQQNMIQKAKKTVNSGRVVELKKEVSSSVTIKSLTGEKAVSSGLGSASKTTSTMVPSKQLALGGTGLVIGGAIKLSKGFVSSLQSSIDKKGYTDKQNLQKQVGNQNQTGNLKAILVALAVKVVAILSQVLTTVATTLITVLLPVIVAVSIISVIASIIVTIGSITVSDNAGETIVEIAQYELEQQSGVYGGEKYKSWYGIDGNWCAMFVSYCANEGGYIEEGIIPKTASVSIQQQWFIDNGLYETKESGYLPKPGDMIIFKNGISHTGIVIAYDADTDRVTTIEGNTGSSSTSPYHEGSQVKECTYSRLATTISGYGTPNYPDTSTEEFLPI